MITARTDDRAVSTAVTHALTLGITTILVASLLISAGTLLETETDRSVRESLERIGERLAAEVTHVDALGTTDGTTDAVVRTVDHPQTVANSRYRVRIVDGCAEIDAALSASEHCLELTATATDETAYIPLGTLDAAVDTDGSVRGGTIAIVHDGNELSVRNP